MFTMNKMSTRFSALSLLLTGLLISTTARAQDDSLSFKTIKLTDRLYVLSGDQGFTGGNIGLTVGTDGVAMIDNGVSGALQQLKAEIGKITDKPIDYLINTHVHGDHLGNNHSFGKDGARIISHENLRASLVKNGVSSGNGTKPASKETLPVLTFSDRMTIHINGDAAKITHFANAHTDGDAIVIFKSDNVIHTGDIMFNGLFPFIDAANGGSVPGVIAALKSIAQMSNDETQIIPGHGPMADKDDVLKNVSMIEDAYAMVSKLVAEGKSDDEVLAANPLSKYKDYHWGFITTEKMTKQLLAAARK